MATVIVVGMVSHTESTEERWAMLVLNFPAASVIHQITYEVSRNSSLKNGLALSRQSLRLPPLHNSRAMKTSSGVVTKTFRYADAILLLLYCLVPY